MGNQCAREDPKEIKNEQEGVVSSEDHRPDAEVQEEGARWYKRAKPREQERQAGPRFALQDREKKR